jgi:hypothetical protein
MYRASVFYFALLFALSIAAFWQTYFVPPKYEKDWHVHLHGVAMFAWMVLLITQAWLIRSGRRPLHRALGKVSYGLVPLIVVSTVLLAHYRLQSGVTDELMYFLAVQAALMATLTLAYGLAMANRRRPQLHMRYMLCAALPLIDPIVARLLFFHAGMQYPAVQAVTYGVTDAILVLLAWNDRRNPEGRRVYLVMLAVFVASQLPTFFLYRLPWWQEVTRAFAVLPLP